MRRDRNSERPEARARTRSQAVNRGNAAVVRSTLVARGNQAKDQHERPLSETNNTGQLTGEIFFFFFPPVRGAGSGNMLVVQLCWKLQPRRRREVASME